jgi:hypothetical protein
MSGHLTTDFTLAIGGNDFCSREMMLDLYAYKAFPSARESDKIVDEENSVPSDVVHRGLFRCDSAVRETEGKGRDSREELTD